MDYSMKKSLIYTRTGDDGTTSLVGGRRVKKSSARLEAYGTIDELSSHIGVLVAQTPDDMKEVAAMLQKIQHKLFNLGAYMASEEPMLLPVGVDAADIEELERAIDDYDAELPKINQFILPGGSVVSAQAHVARTVCRRAERRVLALRDQGVEIAPAAIEYLNRLSDLLFVMARLYNKNLGRDEIFWDKNC